jgi:hypothetical protein
MLSCSVPSKLLQFPETHEACTHELVTRPPSSFKAMHVDLLLLASGCRCRDSSRAGRGWWLVELKASRVTWAGNPQDQEAGSNVREEASAILWEIDALPARTLASLFLACTRCLRLR